MSSPSPRFARRPLAESDPREPKIVLGSSSKFRKQILADMGYSFVTMNPDIDERAITDPDPKMLALRIARAKAHALASKITEPSILITCDQVIVCNKEVRNKPANEEECRRFLRSYGSHPAECINAIVVHNTGTKQTFEGVDISKQFFKEIPEEFISKLIAQGDVMWCAGGFAIELMDPYLDHREGEAESVIGLPPTLTHQLIVEAIGF